MREFVQSKKKYAAKTLSVYLQSPGNFFRCLNFRIRLSNYFGEAARHYVYTGFNLFPRLTRRVSGNWKNFMRICESNPIPYIGKSWRYFYSRRAYSDSPSLCEMIRARLAKHLKYIYVYAAHKSMLYLYVSTYRDSERSKMRQTQFNTYSVMSSICMIDDFKQE